MKALTAKQADLLDFLRWYQGTKGNCPSFQEMMDALDLRSKSGVHRLMVGLEERGFIRRIPNRARAIEILDDPHIPDIATVLPRLTATDIAREARRRGLVVGYYVRDSIRVGEKRRSIRQFREVAA